MKSRTFLLFMFLAFSIHSFAGTLETVRSNFSKASSNSDLCSKMMKQLAAEHTSDELLAYYGAYNAIWANHVFNPASKLKYFVLGKNLIEKAIVSSPKSVEIRFIRLSIQKNSPGFLGYSSSIQKDTEFIKSHQSEIKSEVLKKMVQDILKK